MVVHIADETNLIVYSLAEIVDIVQRKGQHADNRLNICLEYDCSFCASECLNAVADDALLAFAPPLVPVLFTCPL